MLIYFKVCSKVQKVWLPFLTCQSLLLIISTLYHIAEKLSKGNFGKSTVISQTKTIQISTYVQLTTFG